MKGVGGKWQYNDGNQSSSTTPWDRQTEPTVVDGKCVYMSDQAELFTEDANRCVMKGACQTKPACKLKDM